jgi:hypothetical protein
MSVTINGTAGITFNDTSQQAAAGLGYNQTYQDVTASRAASTTYTNTTGRPIWVNVMTTGSGGAAVTNRLLVNGIIVADMNANISFAASLQAIIPPGATYVAQIAAQGILRWIELR